ncbi:hypothetical protein EYF80_044640 [Liparis tanakae]|uniref:Uncharacterized protein n=1 Tax=Liparis tanakae TaxID=230148 RepID=A0A4Z2FX97_9TELE|nr:hypothetical protein EYF80_044640 [Liparis tanakae]
MAAGKRMSGSSPGARRRNCSSDWTYVFCFRSVENRPVTQRGGSRREQEGEGGSEIAMHQFNQKYGDLDEHLERLHDYEESEEPETKILYSSAHLDRFAVRIFCSSGTSSRTHSCIEASQSLHDGAWRFGLRGTHFAAQVKR